MKENEENLKAKQKEQEALRSIIVKEMENYEIWELDDCVKEIWKLSGN